MKARRILWLYCVFACLALVAGLVMVIASSGGLRKASVVAHEAWNKAIPMAETQGERVAQMEEEQRAKRAELSAEDAIRYSAEVQTEQAKLDTLNANRDFAQAAYIKASQAYQKHMGKLIPIIALLILHMAGTVLFWPRPKEALPVKIDDSRPVRVTVDKPGSEKPHKK